ncbi:PIN domain-containing protein [Comamonas sp. NLF-1-9]|uniref:PIN domain-containing protein n=1 Tax=Comamonas sp. NLF-1-9 TaxID=2853163 RepID=UPI001C4926F1|nr:PIN domain-containing protein [Comamonas sp. NLF-1-9]QXL85453.1 PIN domain-containing protein [Comamonas sp. NLF-1-9]
MPAEPPAPKVFLDSNVLIYALGQEPTKKAAAIALLDRPATVSTQVLSEVANVMRRKLGFGPEHAQEVVTDLITRLDVVLIGTHTVLHALRLAQRYALSQFDAQIVASALEADCDSLYSEDMQAGQVFEGRLRVINPFGMPAPLT